MRQLCEVGFEKKIRGRIELSEHLKYRERMEYEIKTLQGVGLSPYFLIVQDITNFIRNKGWLLGPGRGSAAGSLASYLMNIISINPIVHDLIFERFYNPGRNTATRIKMPDIDIDLPADRREEVLQMIKEKYGIDKVAQIIAFQTMKGRTALKDVMRVHGKVPNDEMNRITSFIPQDSKISDDLQEMREETGESSIIRWALENKAGKLKEWCYLDGETLRGPLAKQFEQAIRLEGTKSATSIHPSGIVITPQPLVELCPMVWDAKNKEQITAYEMYDLEDAGIIKFDVLGIATLSKLMTTKEILANGI
jgi:DNA polymerase-3 subunit alpha